MEEEQMLIGYGFSISVGNIIESSKTMSTEQHSSPTGSETNYNSQAIVNNVKIKNRGASNKTRRRKKMINSQTRTVKTTNLTDDGYGWRKYGQKIIHKKLHPKSYYRCTHHKEEKCEAKKWVQQESDSPPVYNSTYLGHHTCKNPLKIPQIFYPDYSSSSSTSSDNILESFDGSYSSMSTQPFILRFDSPGSPTHNFNINGDEQMKTCRMGLINTNSASPMSIPSSNDESMMLLPDQGPEIDTYGDESSYFPSIPSPNCSFGSYEFNMMIEELLLDHDNVNFMHEY